MEVLKEDFRLKLGDDKSLSQKTLDYTAGLCKDLD